MDSIHRAQPEATRENLSADAAVKKIRELVEKAGSCFFVTAVATGDSSGARPMSVREVDERGDLWFLSAIDSHKNLELGLDANVTLYFQGSAHSGFLRLEGVASVSQDKARIRALWTPAIKTWFTGGVDDPRITVIRVRPTEGYYWDTKHGYAVAAVKMLIGAAIGRTLDDSAEGRVEV